MNTLKKLCTFAVLATSIVNIAFGTIAYPYKVDLKQADGTMVTVTIIGDEFVKLYRTLDGYTVMFNDDGHLVYAQQDNRGRLVPTKTLAHNFADRRAAEKGVLGAIPKRLAMPKVQLDSIRNNSAMQLRKMAAKGSGIVPQKVSPMLKSASAVTGERRTLVIQMEFPDKKFTKSRDDFDRLMNEKGFSDNGARGSVRDYFAETSLSQLDVVSEVAGPYMADHNMSYYGASSLGHDRYPMGLIIEAVHKAESDVDFTQFDNDKDGVVDGVHIIYAGYGEESGGGSNAIWAHSSSISESVDGVVVRKYSCSPELRGNNGQSMTHIGVICHELGHVFGCMDYYDTDYDTGGQYMGTGMWDIMGSGNWNGYGSTPAHFNPDVRSRVFGWTNVQTLDGSQDKIDMDAESIYRINTGTDNEYFLLENRRQSGFDVGIPGHGLMIYHATMDGSGSLLGEATNKINSTHRQNFYPVAAGNSGYYLPEVLAESYGSINSASCPFPGAGYNNSFSDGTMPAAVSWDGTSAEYGIDNIRENGDMVMFDVLTDANEAKGFRCTSVSDNEISLQWTLETGCEYLLLGDLRPIQARPENREYKVGETIGNSCTVLLAGAYDRFKHDDLQNGTDYYYRLYKREGQGEWSLGKNVKQRTRKIDPSRYPIYEDFSAEVWRQVTSGTKEYKWTLDTSHSDADGGKGLAYWYVRGGMNHESGFALMSSMMQSPEFSLDSAECAALSFDYTMGDYQELQVYVRREGKSEWEILSTYTGRTDGWVSQLIELKDFGDVVQLAFLAIHDVKYGHTLGREQAYIGLDNVGLETNYALKVKTEKPVYVGNSSVEIPITILKGVQDVEEYGVVISDGNAKEVILSNEEESMTVEGLTPNTSYAYRGYAKAPAGVFYGREEQFKTITLKGEGTKESPFLISDENDLVALSNEVDAGNTFKGCHILLSNDLCLTNAFPPIGIADYDGTPMKVFEGVFDGNGKSITELRIQQWEVIDPNCGAYIYGGGLFGCIGRNGVVKNLTVECSGFDVHTVTGGYIGFVVATNHGLVTNCRTSVSDTFNSNCDLGSQNSYIRHWGGIAGRNYGNIVSCEFRGMVKLYSPESGGIAGCNCGLIKGCINYGDFYVTGGGTIGGISGETLQGATHPFHDDRTYIASIEDCINYGTICANGEYFTTSGIAGNGYGTVLRCSNYGNITVTANNGKSFVAGVAAGEDTYTDKYTIKDCYNGGEVLVNFSANGSYPAVTVGGIAASSFWHVEDCINNANVTLNNTSAFGNQAVAAYIRPVYGTMKSAICNNCFYVEYGSEHSSETGQKIDVSDFDDVVERFNHGRERTWSINSSLPQPIPEENPITIGSQYFISADGFTIPIINTDKDYTSLQIEIRDNDGMIVKTENIPDFDTYAVYRMTGLKPASQYTLHATNGKSSACKEVATGFEGVGTQQFPHIVNKTEQLRALALLANNGEPYKYHHFYQECDLDLACDSLYPWVPIGAYGLGFRGVYDGKNHKLTNLYVDDHYQYAGFIGILSTDGKIANVSFLGENEVNAPHSIYSGGIVGYQSYAFTELSKCFFHGKVSGGYAVGGLFGFVKSPIYDCGAVVQLSGGEKRGGIAGIADNNSSDGIERCYSVAIPTDGKPVAGIANPEDGRTLSFPWQSVDSYYQSGDLVTNEILNHMYPKKEEEMKSLDFVKLLGSKWCADSQDNPINEGYPVYKYDTGHEVFTRNYEIMEDDRVMLYGTYFGTGEKIKSKGIEYRLSYDSSSPYISIEDTSGLITGIAVSLNVLKDVYYLYRAYVELDNSDARIYGEEKTLYVPQEDMDAIKETFSDGHSETNDVYTISGMRIGPGHDTGSLKPGIYIVNRRKVVIR